MRVAAQRLRPAAQRDAAALLLTAGLHKRQGVQPAPQLWAEEQPSRLARKQRALGPLAVRRGAKLAARELWERQLQASLQPPAAQPDVPE